MAGDITHGRQAVNSKFPYYRPITHGLTLVPEPRVKTLGVTPNYVLAYNPEYVASLTNDELEAVFWHEVQHVTDTFLFNDMGLDHELLNSAADCCINDRGRAMGLRFPAGVYFPEQFKMPKGLATYPYYQLLDQQKKANKNQKNQQPSQGQGPPAPALAGPPPPGGAPSTSPRPPSTSSGGQGSEPSPPEVGAGHCHIPEDLAKELDAAVGKTTLEKKSIEQQFAKAVLDHVSKGRGSVPGNLLEWAKTTCAPSKVPWEVVFRALIRGWISSSLRQDDAPTYSRLHRRNFLEVGSRVLYPGDEAETCEVIIIIDTSGSMGGEAFAAALRETRGVLESLGQEEVLVLQADTKVHKEVVVPLYELEAPTFEIKGRGGTSFVQPLERAKELRARCVIYFTDGDGAFPAIPPPFPVVWAYIDATKGAKAPFGETVEVEL